MAHSVGKWAWRPWLGRAAACRPRNLRMVKRSNSPLPASQACPAAHLLVQVELGQAHSALHQGLLHGGGVQDLPPAARSTSGDKRTACDCTSSQAPSTSGCA